MKTIKKSITEYPEDEQRIICENLFKSGDMDAYKYHNVYMDAVNDVNSAIDRYRQYGYIYPKHVEIKNGTVYAAQLSEYLFIIYEDDDDSEVKIELDISSMNAKIEIVEDDKIFGYQTFESKVYMDEGYNEYFDFVPKWINELIGDVAYALGWFEVNVEDGTFGEPYNFGDFLEFLEWHENVYDVSDLDYDKYL